MNDFPRGEVTTGFQVITLNCLWHSGARARLRKIAELVEASDADVVCLQEVIYRSRVDLLRELSPSRPHLAFEPHGLWAKGGLVTMSRWPVESSRYEAFRRCGWWTDVSAADRLLQKGFLVSRHRPPWGPLVVVNTHLLANYDEDWSPGNRFLLQQEDELRQLAAALQAIEPAAAVVAAGDFNLPTTVAVYRELMRDLGLADASAKAPLESPEAAIDHILVRAPHDRVARFEASLPFRDAVAAVDGRTMPLSDHPALAARVVLEARGR